MNIGRFFIQVLGFCGFAFCSVSVSANINFASKESKLSLAGGNVVFQNAISGWNGTLDVQSGTVSGNNITFNQGMYITAQGSAQINGQFTPSGLNPITLNSGKRIIADPGSLLGPLTVIGSANILAGQPELIGTTTLLNSFSELQLNIQNRLGKSILLNNGQLTLLNDLVLGDDVTLTGSGKVNLNKRSLKMPAKDTTWTSIIYFNNATDITLNAKTSLSGTWTFGGGNAVLNGNGNILDLTAGGTLWISSGSDVEFTDVIIRGIGDIYGSIVFEDTTSRIRLSNATLQLASNYTMTTGGIYAEGQGSTIITGTNVLSITTNASFTVDRITFLADSLDATATVNISPNIPDGLRLIYLNHGLIRASGDTGNSALAIANSNAIVGWVRDTSNAVNGLLVATSNAVSGLLVATSNVAAGLVVANSNAINGLLVSTSNAVAGLLVATSNVAAGLVVANSYAIVSAKQLAVDNSTAITGWVRDTSNAVNGLLVATSNAVAGLVVANSNAINGLLVSTSNAVAGLLVATSNVAAGLVVENSYAIVSAKQLAVNNSTAITGWVRDTSNAVAGLLVAVSYATVASGGNALAVDNSNAIVGWIRDTSNAVAGLMVDMSNAIVSSGGNALAVDNSNAIIGWVRDTSNAVNGLLVATSNVAAGLVVANSNAINGLLRDTSNAVAGLVVANSYAIVAINALNIANSYAIINTNNLAIANSTAITGWIQNTSNAVAGLLVAVSNATVNSSTLNTANSDAIVTINNLNISNSYAIVNVNNLATANSNAIAGWVRDTSNAVNGLLVATSNAVAGLVVANSYAIVSINALNIANSYAIINTNNLAVANSTAITGWVQNTSNAVAGLLVDISNSVVTINNLAVGNSNAITGWIQDTSNSMAGLVVDMSNSIVAGGGSALAIDNSNAIIGWIRDTSNAVAGLLVDTSNGVAGLVVANSYAIVHTNQLAVDNSTAITGWIVNTSNAVAGLMVDMSNSIVAGGGNALAVDNSNAIIGWIKDTSNAVHALSDLVQTSTTAYLLGGAVTASLVMNQSIFMNPNDVIVLAGDMTLDGSGATIYYCDAFRSQFIIRPGTTIHLKNIVFSHLNEKTFNIAPNSQLIIDENVFFEMSENMTFSRGLITLGQELNTLFIRGYGGTQRLIFAPATPSQTVLLDLGSNTLALQDVVLEGIEFMQKTSTVINDQVVVGAVACTSDVTIDVNRSNDMNFVIEGKNNIFKMKNNNLAFTGTVLYGNQPTNDLTITFALNTTVPVVNQINFGDNLLYLLSDLGRATLSFSDFFVNVFNQGSNSFVMDYRSGLFGQNLFIQNFPIKVLSADFELGQGLVLATDQANAIDVSFIRTPQIAYAWLFDRPTTAYQLQKNAAHQVLAAA